MHQSVAAGILYRPSNKTVLVAERVKGRPFEGLWEFPGGKQGRGEPLEQTLVRELREELAIEVLTYSSFFSATAKAGNNGLALHFFLITAWNGEPVGREGQKILWVHPLALNQLPCLTTNRACIASLQKKLCNASM